MGRKLDDEGPIFEPLVFLLLRHWSSAIILLVCLFVTERKTLRVPRSEDLGRLVLCGSIGISGTHLLFIYGLRATTA